MRELRFTSILGHALCVAATLSVLGIASSALAQVDYTQKEYRALPRYCHAQPYIHEWLHRKIVPDAEREQWNRMMGEHYRHVHHFCWALISMKRAAEQPQQRSFHYRKAVSDFDYVLNRADPSLPILPEVYLRKGNALRLMGDETAAGVAYQNAIRAKPDYTPAYAALIDVYIALGDRASARQVLEDGLQVVPNSGILQERRSELEQSGNSNR